MSSTSFTTLAPELVIQVFKSTNDFRTVSSLSGTSSRFYKIWRSNIPAISNAVLPGAVEFYDRAQELLNAQEEAARIERETQGPSNPSHTPDASEAAIQRTTQYLLDSKTVLVGLQRFQEDECALSVEGESCFKRAYYRAASLATATWELSAAFLKSWDILDVMQVSDVTRSLVDFSRLSRHDWHPRYFKPGVRTDGHWEIASGKVATLWEELLLMPINKIFEERQHQS